MQIQKISDENPESSQQKCNRKVLTLNNGKLSASSPQYSSNITLLTKTSVIESVQILLLGWNQNPIILRNLECIESSFKNLKLLTLNGNKIVSIEGLSCISMPELVHLELCDNNVVSLKPLRKMNVRKLKQLNLSGIKVVDRQQFQFNQCQWAQLSALIINLKNSCYRGIVKANFELDFAVYSNEQKMPDFLFRRFPKTIFNDYNFFDFVSYF